MRSTVSRIPYICALFLAPALAHAESAAILTVKVDHIAPKGGNLRLALYDEKSFGEDDAAPIVDKIVTATPSVQTVVLPGVRWSNARRLPRKMANLRVPRPIWGRLQRCRKRANRRVVDRLER